jgi:MFS family permease
MLLDISPLRQRDFRLLYAGQVVSNLGSRLTSVALPYQVWSLTHSSFAVGLIGAAQLVPLMASAFIGGAYADAMDRRKLLVVSELLMAVCSAALMINALLPQPSLVVCFVVAALASGVGGFHRPALEALTPQLLTREQMTAAAALRSLNHSATAIGGPAIAGLCIAALGLGVTYALDVATFVVSLAALAALNHLGPPAGARTPTLASVMEGLRYARSRQELLGTYIVDFVAMIFGMPTALFPAFAAAHGGARLLGWLYAATSIGALLATLTSAWTRRVRRHGAAVVLAAGAWGLAIIAFGFAPGVVLPVVCLVLAGAADSVSGIFRVTMWDQTIPTALRGRLAGVEMVSYMSGPLLGDTEAGLVAALGGLQVSIVSGGVLCVAGVVVCALVLPRFWRYRA